MTRMASIAAAAMLLLEIGVRPAFAEPIPTSFASAGADRSAIQTLLATYTTAVSTKNQPLFESLLLNTAIPFSGVGAADGPGGDEVVTTNYERFRKGVFGGPPFTQRFQDVHIDQDGRLASVSLVFVNTAPDGKSWGWKTLQLLKVGGRWKIASEFYTGHAA
jgi:hypothetical protein